MLTSIPHPCPTQDATWEESMWIFKLNKNCKEIMGSESIVVKEGEHSNSECGRVGCHIGLGGEGSLQESFCLPTNILKKDKQQHQSRGIRSAKVSVQQQQERMRSRLNQSRQVCHQSCLLNPLSTMVWRLDSYNFRRMSVPDIQFQSEIHTG